MINIDKNIYDLFGGMKRSEKIVKKYGFLRNEYFISSWIDDDIRLDYSNCLVGDQNDTNVVVSIITDSSCTITKKESLFQAFQAANKANKNRRAIRNDFSVLYDSNKQCVGNGFKVYGVKNKSKKSKKRLNIVNESYSNPFPVKIQFDGSDKIYHIASRDLDKICNTFSEVDAICKFVYGYKFEDRFGKKRKTVEEFIPYFTQNIDSLYNRDELIFYYPEEFINQVFGKPSFQDNYMINKDKGLRNVASFYLKKDFDLLVNDKYYDLFGDYRKAFQNALDLVRSGKISEEDFEIPS